MNWLDVVLMMLVAASIVSGVREGVSRSGFGFIAVLVAFLSAAWLSPANANRFLIVFVAWIGAAFVGAFLLGRWFKSAGLNWLDRLLGGAFGLTNALLLIIVGALALMAFAPKIPREYAARSALAPYVLKTAYRVAEVVPDEMRDRVAGTYRELVLLLPPKARRAVMPVPPGI